MNARELVWTELDGQQVILTAGMTDGATGKRIIGIFATEADARGGEEADQRASGTTSEDRLTPQQIAEAEANSESLCDD